MHPLAWKAFYRLTDVHVAAYRLTGGRVGHRLGKTRTLLLDHVGRKSGKLRTSPLLYVEDGDALAIVASKGGSHKPPAWWLNLREHPETAVQVGGERRHVRARQTTAQEKQRIWPRLVETWPDYERYQERSSRDIPVILLEPVAAAEPAGDGASAA